MDKNLGGMEKFCVREGSNIILKSTLIIQIFFIWNLFNLIMQTT